VSGPGRRDRRSFEPPPWERDAFERLERERASREPTPVAAALESEATALAPGLAELSGTEWAENEMNALIRAPSAGTGTGTGTAGVLPDAQVETMLIGLRSEEPVARREYGGVVNAVAALLVAAGLGLVIWAAALLADAGADAGWLGATTSALMMVWGLMMVGGAVLLWRKYNLRS